MPQVNLAKRYMAAFPEAAALARRGEFLADKLVLRVLPSLGE